MDEVFWSNVVKCWSDAAANVIVLRKELAKVQEERALYRSLVDSFRRSDFNPSDLRRTERVAEEDGHSVPIPHNDDVDPTIQVELMQDAEAGLGRAKEEYRRLQQELAASTEHIKALKLENEKIASNHQQETTKFKDEIRKLVVINEDLQKSLALSKEHSPKSLVAYRDLERQAETLKLSVKDHETENQYLRDELSATQDRLHRAEENSKVLLASIIKLQGITRHSAILRPLSNMSLYSESHGSSGKLSINLTNHFPDSNNNATPKVKPYIPIDVTRSPHESGVVDERSPLHDACVLPHDRQKMLANFPQVATPVTDAQNNVFERNFLKKALGEDVQSLFKYLPESRIDRKAITSSYLCPTLNHHVWCPSSPGQHGFLFVGLGKEKDSYKSPVVRNLFVGLPKEQSKCRTFRYLGKYKVTRVKPLSVDEWNTLSSDVKHMYAKLTSDKTGDVRPLEDIMLAYDKGTLSVPCVQLQFISFDDHIYSALLAHQNDIREN
ncbi:hypothetical protein CVT25_002203 [Psilocybe cyanescens]|uniref:DUF6697 domain-containing protein n=1 Tax=Psilocybe cyanescens TaxID=93625 RepID=A0A409XF69_PSICY|nr:hypothetical protein CVT25_002203 [Psilocybe cyanescens]